jgi:hypothetical protein
MSVVVCAKLEAIIFRIISVSDEMLKMFYVSWAGIISISGEHIGSVHNGAHGVDHAIH